VDIESRTAQLCIAGTTAEFERRLDDAHRLFGQAWDAAADDYDAAMAAHYIAHLEANPSRAHSWNLTALRHAERDPRAQVFMGSLLVSLGHTYEALGDTAEAERHYELAAQSGVQHHRG